MKEYFFFTFIGLCFLLFAPNAHAAPAFVQSSTGVSYSGTTLSFPMTNNVATSDILMGGTQISSYGPNLYSSFLSSVTSTCTTGNWTIVVNASDTVARNLAMFYAVITKGGSCTLNFTYSTSSAVTVDMHEVSGISTSTPLDTSSALVDDSYSTSTFSSGTSTTSVNGDYIFGYTSNPTASEVAPGPGFTERIIDGSGGTGDNTEDMIQSMAGPISASWIPTTTVGNFWSGMMAFEPPPIETPTNVSGYAWGNKMGWVNFGTQAGGLEVYTTTIQGYAWSQNFGWINLQPLVASPVSYIQGVAGANDFGGNPDTQAFSSNVTASDTLIALIQWVESTANATSAVSSVTDTLNNHFTLVTSTLSTQFNTADYGEIASEIAYATGTSAGADTISVNWNNALPYNFVSLMEVSPSSLDQSANATGTSATPSAGTVTNSATGEFGAAVSIADNGFGGYSPGSGWTIQQASGGGSADWATEYETSTPQTLTGNFSAASGQWVSSMATFGGPASGGVVNNGSGTLSGYAWSQGTGYINFQGVTIDGSGVFHGTASGTVAGSLVFDSSTGCTYCNVTTTWTAPAGGVTPLTVSSVYVNGNNPSTITLTPDTTTNVNVNATVTDNTCSEITGGTTTILFYRAAVTSSTCMTSPNNKNCYIATAFTASSTCSGGTINTTTTFPVQYFAQATGASSSFPNQNWIGTVIFNDSTHATSSDDSTHATSSNIMSTLTAVNVSSGSSAAISFIQATTTDGDGCCTTLTSTATFSSTTTVGDFIIVSAGTSDGTNATFATGTISDTQKNTFILATSTLSIDGSSSAYLYYAANIKGGTDTVTFAWTNASIRNYDLAISEYSGIAATSPLDQVNQNGPGTYPVNALSTGNITTTNANDLLYAFILFAPPSPGITPTISSGWTLTATQNSDGGIYADTADTIATSTGTYSNTFSSLSSSYYGFAHIAAFKGASIGGSTINYGTRAASSTTGSVNQTTTIQNAGNSSTTLQLSGTALANGTKSIATSSQHYATSTFNFGGSEQQLSGSAAAVSGFLLTSPTSTTNVQSTVYWGLSVPNGSATGTYTGTNTFTAVFSN